MKTKKEMGKIIKKAFLHGNFNWLIFLVVGGILYAITKQFYWLAFGIIFGAVFDKNDILLREKDNKGKEK